MAHYSLCGDYFHRDAGLGVVSGYISMTGIMSSADIHAVWARYRDTQKPNTPHEAASLCEARRYEAPTMDHFDRLKRDRGAFQDAPRPREDRPDLAASRRYLDFRKRCLALSGGSRVVRPAPVEKLGTVPKFVQEHKLNEELKVGVVNLDRYADTLRRYHATVSGPLTRFQQCEYAFVVGKAEGIFYVSGDGNITTEVP